MKKLITFITLQFFIAFFVGAIYGQSINSNKKEWYIPNSLKLQHAGNTGFLSLGASYFFLNQHVETALFYGYLPKSIGGVDVHTVAVKAYVHPYMFTIYKDFGMSAYLGVGINMALGDQYFIFDHDKRPEDYYGHPGLFLTPVVGARFFYNRPKENIVSCYDLFIEIGTTDRYIAIYSDNESIDFIEIFNLSFGVSLYF